MYLTWDAREKAENAGINPGLIDRAVEAPERVVSFEKRSALGVTATCEYRNGEWVVVNVSSDGTHQSSSLAAAFRGQKR